MKKSSHSVLYLIDKSSIAHLAWRLAITTRGSIYKVRFCFIFANLISLVLLRKKTDATVDGKLAHSYTLEVPWSGSLNLATSISPFGSFSNSTLPNQTRKMKHHKTGRSDQTIDIGQFRSTSSNLLAPVSRARLSSVVFTSTNASERFRTRQESHAIFSLSAN